MRSFTDLIRIPGAAGILTAALLSAPLGIPAAAADPCPDVEVVFARGSGQPVGLGDVGEAFVNTLREQLPGKSVGDYPVDYPATYEFAVSLPAGVQDATGHIQSTVAGCPKTKLVLGGYSQGAAVTEMATNELPEDVADHVAAVTLFGPPTTASGFSSSLMDGPLPALAAPYQAKSISLCTTDDIICAPSGNILAHLQYIPTKTDQAAAFVADRLKSQ